MKLHTLPGLAFLLALALPIGGLVGCQAVKDLLRDPSLPQDLSALGDSVLACAPLGDDEPKPEDVAACLDKALGAAGALADRSDLGEDAMDCADELREAEKSHEKSDMDKAAANLGELAEAIDALEDEADPMADMPMGDGDGDMGSETGSQGSETGD